MDNQKEVLPLRIIAARFINTDEKEGLAELNRITAGVFREIRWAYWTLFAVVSKALVGIALTLFAGLSAALTGDSNGAAAALLGLVPFFILMVALGSWRVFQYGSTRAREPQKAIYANLDDPSVQNLEKLFAVLQIESALRPFYTGKNGQQQDLDESYFFGKLRAAYVTKDALLRSALFPPVGFRFSGEIFMEVDVGALIVKAKAKPNQSGAKRTYDYEIALMSLIEHPVIRSMEIGKRGNQTKIVRLMEANYFARRKTPPSESQLEGYAKQILEIIVKNRSAKL